MSNSKIKMQFSIKKKEELKDLSYEELLKYVEELTDNVVQEKPKKNSNNYSVLSTNYLKWQYCHFR